MLPETASYLQIMDDLRKQIADLVAGLPAEALNWRPVEASLEGQDDHAMNSLAVMAFHAAGAEHFWVSEVVGRQLPTRDRGAEFVTVVDGPEPIVMKLQSTGEGTGRIMAKLTAADLDGERQAGERIVPVRWAILHAIEHTALHLGHMQITYQLWHDGRAYNMPRWFRRLD